MEDQLQLKRPEGERTKEERTCREQRRRAQGDSVLRRDISSLKCMERCRNCGKLISFPSRASRYMYQTCPLCEYNVPPPSALSIPTPHPTIADKLPYPLCAARINLNGEARRCERRRVGCTDLCKGHNRILTKFGKLTYGRYEEPYEEVHKIRLDNPDAEEEEAKIHKLTYDEIVEANKRLEQRTSIEAADTVVLERARQVWLRREQKGTLKKDPLSTEIIANILEPTFGINIADQAPGRRAWLKESFQALMSLPQAPLSILVAMIGHRTEPSKAIDVRGPIEEILGRYGGQRILVPETVNVLELLASTHGKQQDPCPGETKFLRIRYCLQGVVGEVSARLLDEEDFCLSERILIEVPPVASTKRTAVAGRSPSVRSRLTIIKALYGHSHDFLRNFNVTEKVQGLVDLRGKGQYLRFTNQDKLNDIFGDPTRAIERVLKVTYKVDAREGEILAPEAHGRLVNAVHVAAPIVGPSLIVNIATLSPRSTLGRTFSQPPAANGVAVFVGAEPRGRRRRRSSVRSTDNQTIDVTENVRALVALQGGDKLELLKGENVFSVLAPIENADAWQAVFGRQDLLLNVKVRANKVLRELKLQTGPDYCLKEGALVDARPVTPSILIHAAIYGHPTDTTKQFNVQSIIEERVRDSGGRTLLIDTNENLADLFGDPCHPQLTNKILQIRYQVKERTGRLQANVRIDGTLHHEIQVGWPADPRRG